ALGTWYLVPGTWYLLQQLLRIHRPGRIVFVFVVDEHVASALCWSGCRYALPYLLPLRGHVLALAQAVVSKVRSRNLGHDELLALRDAQRDVVPAQQLVD